MDKLLNGNFYVTGYLHLLRVADLLKLDISVPLKTDNYLVNRDYRKCSDPEHQDNIGFEVVRVGTGF